MRSHCYKYHLVLSLACILCASAFRCRGEEPLDSFIAQAIKNNPIDIWFTPSPMEKPKGGYIYKTELSDKTTTYILLCASVECSRPGCQWTVYAKGQKAYRIAGELSMAIESLYIVAGSKPRTYIAYYGDRDFSEKTTFNLVGGKLHEISTSRTASRADTQDLPPEPNKHVDLKVFKVMVGSVLRDKVAKWKPFDSRYSPQQQYLDPNDADEIKSLATWKAPGEGN